MASLTDNSKVVKSFLPSLSHLATVKVTISLLNAFDGVDTFSDIRKIQRNSEVSIEFYEKNGKGIYQRTVKNLSFIPRHLQKQVLETILGLQEAIHCWECNHGTLLQLIKDHEINFQWRSEGTIDTLKTIQRLTLDETIDIKRRFKIACWYCDGESIPILWAKMKLTGQMENFDGIDQSMERFWIRWMHDGPKIPSEQAALEYFNQNKDHCSYSIRYSSFFPFLKPEDRRHLLRYLELARGDDLRLCLNSITSEEEGQILNVIAIKVLYLYVEWPFQSLFLEIIDKMWNYIDENDFDILLIRMFDQTTYREDPYNSIFDSFWNRSPTSFKESAKEVPSLRKKIDSYFERKKAKLEREFNSKKKRKGSETNIKTRSNKSKKH